MKEPQIRVVIRHHRIDQVTGRMMPFRSGVSTWKPTSRGGWTECLLYKVTPGEKKEDGQWQAQAREIAVCSLRDNYVMRIGSAIARGRAAKTMSRRRSEKAIPDYGHVVEALIRLQRELTDIYARGGRVA